MKCQLLLCIYQQATKKYNKIKSSCCKSCCKQRKMSVLQGT
ncbi:hypothetical protein [Clostridium sp. ZBS4]|nr:hypothetical protein [Clostridium sp. ZBS4]